MYIESKVAIYDDNDTQIKIGNIVGIQLKNNIEFKCVEVEDYDSYSIDIEIGLDEYKRNVINIPIDHIRHCEVIFNNNKEDL